MANEIREPGTSKKYQENYEILKEKAEKLKDTKEIDVDDLLDDVKQAMAAYRVCKDRIEKVQTELGELLKDAPGSTTTSEDNDEKTQKNRGEDDAPF